MGRRGQNTRKRHERSITMRYLTCQLSRARIFSYSSSEQQGSTPSTNRKSLSVPIEDPETTETTLARADARLPSSSMRAHIHIHTLSLSLCLFFIRLAFSTGPRRVCVALERRRRSLVLLPSRSLLVNPRVSTRSRAALCSPVRCSNDRVSSVE